MNAFEAKAIATATRDKIAEIDRSVIIEVLTAIRKNIDTEVEKAAKNGDFFCKYELTGSNIRYVKFLLPKLKEDRFSVQEIKHFHPDLPWRVVSITLFISWSRADEVGFTVSHPILEKDLSYLGY